MDDDLIRRTAQQMAALPEKGQLAEDEASRVKEILHEKLRGKQAFEWGKPREVPRREIPPVRATYIPTETVEFGK